MAAIARFYNQSFDRSPAATLAVTNGLMSAFADVVAQGTQMGLAYREASKEPTTAQSIANSAIPPAPNPIPSYDPQRTLRFLAFGTMMGPFLAKWNHFLEVTFPLRASTAASAASNAVSKLGPGAVKGGNAALPSKIGDKPITASGAVGRAGTVNAVAAPVASSASQQGKVNITSLAKRVGCDQIVMAPIGLAVFLGSMGIMEGHGTNAIKKKYVDLFPPAILTNWKVWPVIQFVNFRFMPLPYRVPFQATCGIFWTLYLSLLNSSKPTAVEAVAEDLRSAANTAADSLVEAAKTSKSKSVLQ